MTAVVTGSSGHIGYNVALQLLEKGHQVILLVRNENVNVEKLRSKGANVYRADLFNPESYQDLITKADVLFHIASENTTETSDRNRVIRNTFGLSQIVLDTAIKAGVQTIVYTSSVVVLGRSASPDNLLDEDSLNSFPESPYVEGKLLAENYCRELIQKTSRDIRIVYPSWVVGEGDSRGTPPHKIILKFLEKGEKFTFKGGISVAHVHDIAVGHVNAWLLGKPKARYILGGQNITFSQFYNELASQSGLKRPQIHLPKAVILAGSYLLKLVLGKKNPVDPGYVKSVVGSFSWYDSQKAVKEINYHIRPVNEIIRSGILQAGALRYQTNHLFESNNAIPALSYEKEDILLITGFPGWLSNRMVDIMIRSDYFGKHKIKRKVRLLVQKGMLFNHDLPENFEIYYGNLNDKDSLEIALKGVKCVYHLAGVVYPKKISAFYKVNEEGTKNLVDACFAEGTRRFIFASTDSVCGYSRNGKLFSDNEPSRPYKNYGKSKFLAEKYIMECATNGNLDATILRGFWFFGPHALKRNVNFYKMLKWRRQIIFGNGKNLRTITHIDNLVQAFIKSEKNSDTFGKWYWIGDGSGTLTVDEIYRNITTGLGVKFKPLYIPNWCCEIFNMMDSVLGWFGLLNPTIHAAGKFHKNIAARSDRAVQDFDYEPKAGFKEINDELNSLNL